jgi:hypothetical protein
MRMPSRPPPAEGFLGQECTYCGRVVKALRGMSLVCIPREVPMVWRLYHSGCAEEEREAEMSRLLGGR